MKTPSPHSGWSEHSVVDHLSLYRYFLVAARCGSISECAKALYVTQPAVSRGLRQLEEVLGVPLFFRDRRGIRLSPEGELLLPYVKNAFSFLSAGEEKLRDIAGLGGGLLRIGASDMTLRFSLLDCIERFAAAYPKVKLTVTNAPTPDTLAALRAGQIDLGVVSEPFPPAEDLLCRQIREIRDIFVASSKYPLADRPVTPAELSAYPLVMLEKNTSTRAFCDRHLRECGLTPDPAIELATSDLVLEFALRGIGVGCVMEDFARQALATGEIYKVALTPPFPPRHFCAVRLRSVAPSTASKAFLALLEAPREFRL